MQTFLPYPSFELSAASLDSRRLGKQRSEAIQIFLALKYPRTYGWSNHTAVQMWKGYENALLLYAEKVCLEFRRRGYNDLVYLEASQRRLKLKTQLEIPHWIGNEEFHSSHRAALLHKDYEFYSAYGWDEEPSLNYVWPKGKED